MKREGSNSSNTSGSGHGEKQSQSEDQNTTTTAAAVRPPTSVLIPNTRGESNNYNNNNNSHSTNNNTSGGGATKDVIQLDSELISDSLMNEIKENISPEHTITATNSAAVGQQQQQQQQPSPQLLQVRTSLLPPLGESSEMSVHRVKFKLGSTEDFDDLLMAEDEELNSPTDDGDSPQPQQQQRCGSTSGLTSDDSCLSLDVEGGIGQIARDSMVILNSSSSGGGGGGGGSGGGVNGGTGGGVKTSSPITSKGE